MADNKKKNSKTINFAEKKREIANKKQIPTEPPLIHHDNRVIQYDINKMREKINQKSKNKKPRKSTNLSRSKVQLALYSVIFLLFMILAIYRVLAITHIIELDKPPEKFVSQSTKLSTDETVKYQDIVESLLAKEVKANGNIDMVTTSVHKNGDTVFCSGYFTYPDEKNKIYFDSVVKKDKVASLLVNGFELKDRKK